jgi:hypothetical protein
MKSATEADVFHTADRTRPLQGGRVPRRRSAISGRELGCDGRDTDEDGHHVEWIGGRDSSPLTLVAVGRRYILNGEIFPN